MRARLSKLMFLVTAGAMFSGSCLPEDFWVNKWGEIVNGSIIGVINLLLAPTGIEI